MNKNFKCWAGRASLIGDTIMFLPVLNYLESLYPNSYKIFPISKKTSQSAPLFINHPLIDKIHILEEWENLGPNDIKLYNSCNIRLNIFPQHPDGLPCVTSFWWNDYNLCEETFRMAGYPIERYRELSKEFQYPKLYKWFPVEKLNKTIGIWPFAAYGKEPRRSPTKEWWEKLIPKLFDLDYEIAVFGHPSDPPIFGDSYLKDLSSFSSYHYLSFFDQIKLSLGCDLCINTDSGSGWVIGAYGHPQITLLTDHAPNHIKNLLAFNPFNYNNLNIALFARNSCSCIGHEEIIESIKKLEIK